MGEQVSAEAVEAAARAIVRRRGRSIREHRECGSDCVHVKDARAALTAALPYLAAHQPARVVPSAEEVRGKVVLVLANAGNYHDAIAPHVLGRDMSQIIDKTTTAVLALFASQPTVAEVREQVAREMRVTPVFADSLPNDGEYEYTSTSNCDGSNVAYLRRLPRYEGAHFPWEQTTREAWESACTETKGGE